MRRCEACDLEFVGELPTPERSSRRCTSAGTSRATGTATTTTSAASAIAARKARARIDALEPRARRGARWTSTWAAPTGAISSRPRARGFDAHGVEPSPEARARGWRRRSRRASWPRSLDALDGAFDVVTFWDVLEHLARPPRDAPRGPREAATRRRPRRGGHSRDRQRQHPPRPAQLGPVQAARAPVVLLAARDARNAAARRRGAGGPRGGRVAARRPLRRPRGALDEPPRPRSPAASTAPSTAASRPSGPTPPSTRWPSTPAAREGPYWAQVMPPVPIVQPPGQRPVHEVRRYMQRKPSLGRVEAPIERPQ